MTFSCSAQEFDTVAISELVGKTHEQQMKLLNPLVAKLDDRVDSVVAFQYVDELKQNGSTELKWLAVLIEAQYISYHSPLAEIEPALQRFAKMAHENHIFWLEARLNNMLGHYYFSRVLNYEKGFEHFTRAVEILHDENVDDFPKKAVYLTHLGFAHYTFHNYREAVSFFTQAFFYKQYLSRYQVVHVLNNIGLSYRHLGTLDSSDHYFNMILEGAKNEGDSVWFGISTGNLGDNLFLRKQFELARPMLLTDIRIALKYEDLNLASGTLTTLGDMALQEGKVKEAKEYLTEAVRLAHISKNSSQLSTLYPLLAKLEAELGNPTQVSKYLDSAMVLKDSLNGIFNGMKLARVEQRLQIENTEARLAKTEHLRKNQLLERNSIIALLFATLVIVGLLFSRFQLKAKNREQKMLADKVRAEHELEVSSLHLQEFINSLKLKNELLESSKEELFTLRQKLDNQTDAEDNLVNSVILTDDDWRRFRKLFERVHPGFFDRLEQQLPELSSSEVRLLTLYRLELSNKEIAAMLGVGANAVRTLRSRMKPKLSLNENESVERFARSI